MHNGGPSSFPADERLRSDRLSGDTFRGRPDDSPRIVSSLSRLSGAAAVFYPLVVYYGLTHWPTRPVALATTAFFVAMITLRGHSAPASYGDRLAPAALAVLAGLALVFDVHRLMLALPVAINLVLLAVFSRSLRCGVPVVERLARLQSGDLGDEEVQYCRCVTTVWCVFFVGNALAAATLALFAPLSWWAFYTGILSYVLVAIVFAVEYSVRISRFPRARPLRWQPSLKR